MSSEKDKNRKSKSKKKTSGLCCLSAQELIALAAALGYFLADDLSTAELVVLIEFLSTVQKNISLVLAQRECDEESDSIIIID